MVSVGGMNINFGFDKLGTIASWLFWGAAIFVVIGLVGWWLYSSFKNKSVYNTPVTLTWYYDNGTSKTTFGLKGGKYFNRSNVQDFRVKIPKSFKKKELGYTPDFSKADADGTIHFITSGDGSLWQQVEHKLVTTEEREIVGYDGTKKVYTYSLLIKPVPTEIKTATVNAMKNWREVINSQKATIFAIGLGMFLIMVIGHLVSLYIQTKIKCPLP